MEYLQKAAVVFLILIIFGLVSNTFQTKKVNCRKYVYAPVCRGVQAKRALPVVDFEPLREPRGKPVISDLDTIMQWKDKDRGLYDNTPLQVLLKKIKPESNEFDYIDGYY